MTTLPDYGLRFTRRSFLVAGAVAVPALTSGCDHAQPSPVPQRQHRSQLTQPGGQLLDLASRWRHLKPRLTVPGLVAAWPFDEGSGYAFLDATGHGHDLFIGGSNWNTSESGLSGAVHRPGQRGGAVYLDGTRRLQSRTSPQLVDTVTVSAWFRLDRMPQSTAGLLRIGTGSRLWLDRSGVVGWSTGEAAGSPRSIQSPRAAVATGRWTQVAVVVRGVPLAAGAGRQEVSLYVDGRPVSETRWSQLPLAPPEAGVVLGEGLVGSLDMATIHDRALSAEEMLRLYAVGLPTTYTQSRETIDTDAAVWNGFAGSEPVPHPIDADTLLTVRFDGTASTDQGESPVGAGIEVGSGTVVDPQRFVPGRFGAALRADGGGPLSFRSPVTADTGTVEVWYLPVADPGDPSRLQRKELLRITGSSSALSLFTESGRWQVGLTDRSAARKLVGPRHRFVPGSLEHVAVNWARQSTDTLTAALFINGVEVASRRLPVGSASAAVFDSRLEIGGPVEAPAHCLVDDVRLSRIARGWGNVCPRGQAATEAAGLDLRDRCRRPAGTSPLLWRADSPGSHWTYLERPWVHPELTGDDPDAKLAMLQPIPSGLHAVHHPDAHGDRSSLEAGVSFPALVDGWAGVFVHSAGPASTFSAVSFAVNPARGLLRLGHHERGALVGAKVLPYDFPMMSRSTYEVTLTAAGDGVLRGFVDGNNAISMRQPADARRSGYAGLFTESAAACFENVHFTALTPPTATSRRVQLRVDSYGDGAGYTDLAVTPFRWHKRRGLPPWQYTTKDPELPGNIAGAATAVPLRPIPPAFWRSEDSANSDLVIIDGRVVFFLRGNPRLDGRSAGGRIGVLGRSVERFDGVHFHDPNRGQGLAGPTLLQTAGEMRTPPGGRTPTQLNNPASAYVGDGRLLCVATKRDARDNVPERVVYSYFDVRSSKWLADQPEDLDTTVSASSNGTPPVITGTPELVSLRDPDDDGYLAVLFHQIARPGRKRMAMTGLRMNRAGPPASDPSRPTVASLSRPSGRAIYGFRVLFDNGIYYLHYNEGPNVPDWPSRFVLASTLDPYAGPWLVSPSTAPPTSSYFRRGGVFEPDNGAIWQGTMVKHRGSYYLYYENYHAIGDVDVPYQHYNAPQAGSRVGFATG